MPKTIKKLLALILCCVCLISVFPHTAFAANGDEVRAAKKIISVVYDDSSSFRVCGRNCKAYDSVVYISFSYAQYDALDRACRDYGYICDVRRYDYPQHAEIRLTDEQMLIYLNPEANDYYSSKDNVDKYTYELYKYEKNTDGQRVWTVYRFLLDENLKSKIKSLSVDEKIAEYIIKACGPEETQLMT